MKALSRRAVDTGSRARLDQVKPPPLQVWPVPKTMAKAAGAARLTRFAWLCTSPCHGAGPRAASAVAGKQFFKPAIASKARSHLSMALYCLDRGDKFPGTCVLHITARKDKRPQHPAQR